MLPANVAEKLDTLPASPGVYVFLDRSGGCLYVGKARSLRSRVRSYFQAGTSDTRFFIAHLPEVLGDLETFVVANEKEAALLENALIKERQPRFNFRLRDDKEFLSLRLDTREPWPRLRVVRRPAQDGARYFGPYDSATSARRTLRLVNRHFRLRTCTDAEFAARVRPCLQHQIQRCPAPCVLEVDRDDYLAQARLVGLFLEGRHDELLDDLDARMRGAAAALEFERAARYRDQRRAVERVREEQRVASARDVDQDAIGLAIEGDRGELALVEVRAGRITNVRTYALDDVRLPDDELIAAFVRQRYADGAALPDEVLVPVALEAADGLAEALSEGQRRKVRIKHPQRGAGRDLVAVATENAAHAFKEKRRAAEDVEGRLADVQRRLRLPRLPRRIECVDISHTHGTDTVAALTAMRDGALDRARYRSFHLRGVSGGDDYGAMREVLTRRLARAREPGWELPDLLVVDGGKGQLAVAVEVLREIGIDGLPICGLAKEREDVTGKTVGERVFLPGQKNPIPLRERSAAQHFLGLVRDEAHRASNLLREKLGARRRLRSGLEDVPGVGPRTRTRLLRALGSLRAVLAADVEALLGAGASAAQAAAIVAHFAGVVGAAAEVPSSEVSAEADDALDARGGETVEEVAFDEGLLDEPGVNEAPLDDAPPVENAPRGA